MIRGTPSEEDWPGIKELPLFPQSEQTAYKPRPLSDKVPLDELGLDLLD